MSEAIELGPRSVLGRLATDWRMGLTGLSAGLLQLMHPGLGAGVAQHSAFFTEPFDRIARSVPRIVASIVAPDSAARAREIRDYHRDIKGHDDHGRRYHALDPDTYWWAHATFTWGFLKAADRFHHAPPRGEVRDRYYAESVEWYRRYQLSMRPVPADLRSFELEFDRVCATELELTPAAARAVDIALHGRFEAPNVPAVVAKLVAIPATPMARLLSIGGLPTIVRRRFDIPWTAADRRSYAAVVLAIRNGGRLLPERLTTPAHVAMLKRVGATTELASAS
jgi:uncharacterized protein (DUF2236 family)